MTRISLTRKLGIVGSTAAVAAGMGVAGVIAAPGASAATNKPVVISAPGDVTSGSEFELTCNIKPRKVGKSWKGATAVVHEKGLPVHASRVIGAKGECSMRLILNATGNHRLRVVAIGGNNVLKSQWIKIHIS